MKPRDDTTQAHDVAVRADDVAPDGPVKVDTAMRRYKQMYEGRTTAFDGSHFIGLFARLNGL